MPQPRRRSFGPSSEEQNPSLRLTLTTWPVQNPWKYRCPGCSLLTCSLPCVKSHKQRTSCTGKRNRTDFVPLSQFDDSLLLSDYSLLEETKRLVESAHQAISGFGSNIRFQLPMRLHMLRNAANRRRTRLLVLPQGMSMRRNNQSRYYRRNNCIYWTVEWRFSSTDIILMDHE
ncbi:box C/D snoRNA protein 1-like [Zingiber officinale]|uniref:box C/D snoRNA protein 1-like n=1 Tax=Zingiber officinale TaxID=94328 RepID=UPI001C4ABB53|nr:box C/D snoRNA protein 1-like [Zingiber officinale]